MENILISACLIGVPCRYDGESRSYPELEKLKEKYNLIPICPEVLGGLPVPRTASERQGEKVVNAKGEDVTENYKKGATASYELAQKYNCKIAVMKEKSPACATHMIYDGSFSRKLVFGLGVCAEHLKKKGLTVISEDEAAKLL